MVHGASGGIISQDLLYIIGEDKQQSWINQIVLSASDPDPSAQRHKHAEPPALHSGRQLKVRVVQITFFVVHM